MTQMKAIARFKIIHAEAEVDAALPIERAVLSQIGGAIAGAATTDEDQLVALAHDADALLTEITPITRRLLTGLSRCQVVVAYSIGLDHIDTQAATDLGIVIAHTPGFCTEEVANHAMLLVMASARRLLALDHKLRAGWWPAELHLERDLTPMGRLYGETLGLLSFGGIARSVATKAQAFGMTVQAFDPFVSAATFQQLGVRACGLDELLETSDYLSVHTPLTVQTRHLLAEGQLRRMKPGAFLINTSRGAVVNEAALVRALQEKWIAGAALDVFEREPLPPNHPLLSMSNVILTPHVAYCSNGAYAKVRRMAAEAAACVLRGEWPLALANPAVKGRSRMEVQAA